MQPSPATAEENPANRQAIVRLTALWALAEAGLGGVLFALRIPLTGFLVGAVSVVILSLIARLSGWHPGRILGSMVTVLIVKAAVSPHAPPGAYLAVAFQGALAAILFHFFRKNQLAPLLLGAISMVESALQKMILLTLIFGKNLWEAVEQLAQQAAKTFGLNGKHYYTFWLIGAYLLLYLVWGLLVGAFAVGLPRRMEAQKEAVLKAYLAKKALEEKPLSLSVRKRRVGNQWFLWLGIGAFIVFVFWASGKGAHRIWESIFRSVAAVLLLFYGVRPLVQYLLRRWLKSRSGKRQQESEAVLKLLPALRSYVPTALAAMRSGRGVFRRLALFMTTLLILSLYAPDKSPDPAL